MEHVAILGASNNPSRYAYKAQIQLIEQGHIVYPVSLHEEEILGLKSYHSLLEIDHNIDTVTVYINPTHLKQVDNHLIELKPKRVIFNPGSESTEVMNHLKEEGIFVQSACTLVLLSIQQFEARGRAQ